MPNTFIFYSANSVPRECDETPNTHRFSASILSPPASIRDLNKKREQQMRFDIINGNFHDANHQDTNRHDANQT
jgi:hypothetical protein